MDFGDNHFFQMVLVSQTATSEAIKDDPALFPFGVYDSGAVIVETKHRLKGKNTALSPKITAFDPVVSHQAHINFRQHIHEELNGVGFSRHIQAAATAASTLRTLYTDLRHPHIRHMQAQSLRIFLEKGKSATDLAIGKKTWPKGRIQFPG
jgi:hypothetical protein